MSFTLTPINVKDASGSSKPMIIYNDGTNNAPANAVLDSTGALISPATAGNQTTTNSTLATIASQTSGLATAAAQTTGNSSLATIATNTTGAATATKQDTGNTSLATIATNTTGAATAANQTTHNTKLDSIITNTTGAATSAKQDTGNTALAAIQTSVANIPASPSTAANQTTGNTSLAAISTAAGATSDSAVTSPSASGSLIALLKGVLSTLPIRTRPNIPATANFTRPADTTAYSFGDLVANSTTAASVTALSITAARSNDEPGEITGCILSKTGTGITQAIFQVHLFNVNPCASAPAAGDNGAYNPASNAGYLGSLEVTVDKAYGNGASGMGYPLRNTTIPFKPASGTQTVYALLEARGAYTPANGEVFTLQLSVA